MSVTAKVLTFTAPILRKKIDAWLRERSRGLEPGRFSFCAKGSFAPTDGQQGLASSCFALKIAWQLGLWETWEPSYQKACMDFLCSFQCADGFVRDPWICEKAQHATNPTLQEIIRAETRQTLSLLLSLGRKPVYVPPLEYETPAEIQSFVHGLNWRNPWAAGSHASHLAFFIAARQAWGVNDHPGLEEALFESLMHYHNPQTGAWHDPAHPPSTQIQINGAMKVLTALAWMRPRQIDFGPLIAFACTDLEKNDSCGLLNNIFVLNSCLRLSGANHQFAALAERKLVSFLRQTASFYQWREGAFSFYKNKAQHIYYGVPVSTGEKVADLHGTAMQVWAWGELLTHLGLAEKLNWRVQTV